MNLKRKERGKNFKIYLFGIVAVAAVGSLVWLLVTKLEGEAPVIAMELESGHVPADIKIPVTINDKKSGIRKVFVSLLQDGREVTLANVTYNGSGDENLHEIDFTLDINAREKGLKDGEALLRIAAWDRSWRQWFTGNLAYLEKEIIVDTIPPRISPLTRQHNLSQGGAGLVIYRLSEKCETHGVRVGDNFFQGRHGLFEDDNVYAAFFAMTHEQGSNTEISLYARDRAGNEGRSGIPHFIQNRSFPSDNLGISENFLRSVLPEFYSVPGFPIDKDSIEQFLFINNDLREINDNKLLSLHEKSGNRMYWDGGFAALPRAQRRAGFGDRRAYLHQGKVIDNQFHLGVDLASLMHAPIPAANSGRVIYADWEGIYGDTVVIDHGFGLLSLYSHLSQVSVNVGDLVSKGDIIGNTGTTGFAGGDHLHFSIIVGNVFVNPYEWWDATWVRNNITSKIETTGELVKN